MLVRPCTQSPATAPSLAGFPPPRQLTLHSCACFILSPPSQSIATLRLCPLSNPRNMASLPGTDHNLPFQQPVCQNCQTSTTPLWRRDEAGSVLCNACGLFLKLHGRPRPISLKTDVIKSRNRVKSANQGPKKKVRRPIQLTVRCASLTDDSSSRMASLPLSRNRWRRRHKMESINIVACRRWPPRSPRTGRIHPSRGQGRLGPSQTPTSRLNICSMA